MKNAIFSLAFSLTAAIVVLAFAGCTGEKGKPYPLDACLVCGMKFDAKSKPYVFVYNGQEFKVCDKSEKDEFDKDPGKYVKVTIQVC
jgi:YHS domain-containing protein